MTAAIFGLLGVIVGGLLQAATTWWLALLQNDRAARKAGRLLARDLARCRFIVQAGADGAVAWSAIGLELGEGLQQWRDLSDTLAGTVRDDKEWVTIAQAVSALQRLEQRGRWAPEGEELSNDERELLARIAEATWEANLAASLIGVAGARRRWGRKLKFWGRLSEKELQEQARDLVRYSYEAEGKEPPDDFDNYD